MSISGISSSFSGIEISASTPPIQPENPQAIDLNRIRVYQALMQTTKKTINYLDFAGIYSFAKMRARTSDHHTFIKISKNADKRKTLTKEILSKCPNPLARTILIPPDNEFKESDERPFYIVGTSRKIAQDVSGFGQNKKVVYGTDHKGNQVAIAKIKWKNPVTKEEIENEIKLMKEMKGCKNIIQIKNAWHDEENKRSYLIMERCTFEDLLEHIEKFKPEGIKIISLDICNGLIELLSKGYVHLDLKPHNIGLFIDSDGNIRAVLLDLDTVTKPIVEQRSDMPLVTQNLASRLRESALKSTTAGFTNAPVLSQYEGVCDRQFQGTLTQPGGQILSHEEYTLKTKLVVKKSGGSPQYWPKEHVQYSQGFLTEEAMISTNQNHKNARDIYAFGLTILAMCRKCDEKVLNLMDDFLNRNETSFAPLIDSIDDSRCPAQIKCLISSMLKDDATQRPKLEEIRSVLESWEI